MSSSGFRLFKLSVPLFIPLLAAIWIHAYHAAQGPHYLCDNLDPEYCYLLNGLNIINGYPPAHTDHPGTTLQCLEALVIQLSNPLGRSSDLTLSVLSRPEHYLELISAVLIVLFVISHAAVGYVSYHHTKSYGALLMLQMAPFLDPEVFRSITRVYPETLSLVLANLLLCVLIPLVEGRATDAEQRRASVSLGILGALVVVTKMLAIPVVVFLPAMLKTWRQRAHFFIAAIVAGAVALMPVYRHFGVMVKWIYYNVIYSGSYGKGSASFIDRATYFTNLIHAIPDHPAFFLVLGVALMAIVAPVFVSADSSARQLRPALAGLVLGAALSVLIIAKSPVAHYFILPLALSGLLFHLSVRYVGLCFPRMKRQIEAVALLTAIVLIAGSQIGIAKECVALRNHATAGLQARDYVDSRAKSMPVVAAYASSSPAYALAFGNEFAGYIYTYILRELYPGTYNYNIWVGRLSRFDYVSNRADLPNLSGEVLLEGTWLTDQIAGDAGTVLFSKATFSLQKQFGDEKIYLLHRQ